jgi:hypothetical protein
MRDAAAGCRLDELAKAKTDFDTAQLIKTKANPSHGNCWIAGGTVELHILPASFAANTLARANRIDAAARRSNTQYCEAGNCSTIITDVSFLLDQANLRKVAGLIALLKQVVQDHEIT